MTVKRIDAEATASAATIYTAPSGAVSVITAASVINNSGSDETLEFHIVNSGGTAGDTTRHIKALNVPTNSETGLNVISGQSVNAGGTIQILASSASALVVHIVVQEL